MSWKRNIAVLKSLSAKKCMFAEYHLSDLTPLGDKTYTNSNSKMTFSRVGYTSRHCFQRLEGLAPLLEVTR